MNKVKLSTLLTIKNGKKYSHLQHGDIPVYGSGGLMTYVNDYLYDRESILLPRKGTLDNIQFVNEKFWTVDTIYYTEVNPKVNGYFLYNYLRLLNLSGLDSGSTLPSMTQTSYYDIDINLPERYIQDRIAEIVLNIDKKIELNSKINAELEALTKLIYDYWFVQFDFPNGNGKPYKLSGGKMVWSEELNREIPEGWSVKNISDCLTTSLGGTPSTKIEEYWNDGDIPWLSSEEVSDFPILSSNKKISRAGLKNSATSLLPEGSVVISIVRYIRTSILGMQATTNQSVVAILESDLLKKSYIYPFLISKTPKLMLLRTGAQQPHINKNVIDTTQILIPDEKVLRDYYELVNPMYEHIISIAAETKKLTELRDWLLPMLMNGQVKVQEN